MTTNFYDASSRDDDAALTPTGMLLLFAQYAYDKRVSMPISGRRLSADMVQRVLDAASAEGFTKTNELRSMLQGGKFSSRCKALANAAAEAAGRDVFDAIYTQFVIAAATKIH